VLRDEHMILSVNGKFTLLYINTFETDDVVLRTWNYVAGLECVNIVS